jgi:hypothetical protein
MVESGIEVVYWHEQIQRAREGITVDHRNGRVIVRDKTTDAIYNVPEYDVDII